MRKVKKAKTTEKISFRTLLHRVWICFWAVIILCFLGFNIWGYYSGFLAKKWNLITQSVQSGLKDAGFTLNEILITGRNRTSITDVCQILEIPQESCHDLSVPKGRVITTFDIKEIQEKFKKLPWVKNVVVRRQLPDILYIDLVEKKPIALWQNNKKYYPLDEQGNVVEAQCPECSEYLLLIVGHNAPKQTPHLIEQLEKHESIYNRIQSAKWVDDRRWDLYIDDINNGKKVLLPDLDLEESLNRLENLQKTKNVLDRQIELLDLRLDDRIIIKANGKESITSLKKGGK